MGRTYIRDKIVCLRKEVSPVHPWRHITLAVFAVIGWLVVAACGTDPTPAPTFTPVPASTPTVALSSGTGEESSGPETTLRDYYDALSTGNATLLPDLFVSELGSTMQNVTLPSVTVENLVIEPVSEVPST